MKKNIFKIAFLMVFLCSFGMSQELKETHTRGLLHQSVYNTGALGSPYNIFRSKNSADGSCTPFEWPGNSRFKYNNRDYWFYNSCGGGLVMLCDTGNSSNHAKYLIYDSLIAASGIDMIGCLGQGSGGEYRDGTGLFYWPGTVTKTTNYPLNSDGTWNTSYDPKEAEEIITSSVHTPYGITITRTSRAWSYPGYDGFIIYDYEFKNTGIRFKGYPGVSPTHATDTLFNIIPSWVEFFQPSYVYLNRVLDLGWSSGLASKMLSRFDLRRYMQYVHSPDGRPEPDPTNFLDWSLNGTYGGGLTAPASVGYMLLYFDYEKQMPISQTDITKYINTATSEQLYVYDHGSSNPNSRYKQPWVVATTQANLSATKIMSHVGGTDTRPYRVWNPRNTGASDSANFINHFDQKFADYWYGRGKPNNNYNFASPMVHSYAIGPYKLAPDESFHVVFAELAGFGPGRKGDAKYYDYGGGNETVLSGDLFHPVASWDSVINYTNAPVNISSTPGIGINYIPRFGVPAFIRDTNVVSIRDVADRCAQLYKGHANVIKYDTAQYEPSGDKLLPDYAPSPAEIASRPGGWNAGIKMPLPAPVVDGIVTETIVSGLKWKGTVDSLTSTLRPYVNSGLAYYEILRSTSKIGPWRVLERVNVKDSRFWDASTQTYTYIDGNAKIGNTYYYAIVTVDSIGVKSGLTNIITQKADLPYYQVLSKVYAAPNPYIFVSGYSSQNIDNSSIKFFGLTKNSTIHIFSFSGQLIKTLHSDGKIQSAEWDLRSETQKKIAPGVYYFTVQDNETGKKAWNKFVVIH